MGQFGFYSLAIAEEEPNRTLFLAMPENAYKHLFKDPISKELARINKMHFIVFDVETEKIVSWIK